MGLKEFFYGASVLVLVSCGGNNNGGENSGASYYKTTIPIDANIELGQEKNILYYADPRTEENGENRVLRINYANMDYTAIPVDGNNPHSIDRAGNTDKFYIRTQNSYSFDVVNFKTGDVKTVDLDKHKPRAIGGFNKKYNIQLLSVKNRAVVDVIDVDTDEVIAKLGDDRDVDVKDGYNYDKSRLTSNAGSGSATGHSFWIDWDHFALIDRVHREVIVYKVNIDKGQLEFQEKSRLATITALHTIERVNNAVTKKDFKTFYALGEGILSKKSPYVKELIFDRTAGRFQEGRITYLSNSKKIVNTIKPTTHHAGISPDGKYMYVPVLDGKVYVIDRESMKTIKIVEAGLGAAHIEFSVSQNVAVVTNHFDTFVTIVDLKTFEVKKIEISKTKFDPAHKHLLQPHFSYISPDGRYYYTFASQDGQFIKIDLKTLKISGKLKTGGAPEQAHS